MVETSRDLLDDLAEVLGGERINAADAPAMLRKLAPNWAPDKNLIVSADTARQEIRRQGADPPETGTRSIPLRSVKLSPSSREPIWMTRTSPSWSGRTPGHPLTGH
jgi:hypothetical protein